MLPDDSPIARARHLRQRAGFAEAPARTLEWAERPLVEQRAGLLSPPRAIGDAPYPGWIDGPLVTYRAVQGEREGAAKQRANMSLNRAERALLADLRAWWLRTLIATEDPLGARMTLFWQNHFTADHRKVRHAQLMYRHQATISRHALGRFGDLLGAMLRDPATLLYLDGQRNTWRKPNENLARELLELFTLGEGEYREADVKAVARVLTGHGVDPRDAFAYRFHANANDPGPHTLLGIADVAELDDLVAVLLAQPATARFIAAKLWTHFVSPTPDPAIVEDWARAWRASGYDTGALVAMILESDAFMDPAHRGRLFKSPIEFVVGTHRALALAPSEDATLVRACLSMQQPPYQPPNVRGWVGGERWINSHTLLARQRFVNGLLRDDAIDRAALEHGLDAATLAEAMVPDAAAALALANLRPDGSSGSDDPRRFVLGALLKTPLWHLA